MFLLICGENTVESRTHFSRLKNTYRSKHTTLIEIHARDLEEHLKNGAEQTLFGDPIIYITEGLYGQYARQKKKVLEEMRKLDEMQDVKIINWEDKSAYELKLTKATFQFKEFKADKTVFDFQELCTPGNRQAFIQTLGKLIDQNDPVFLFTMLHRHVRTMLLLKTNQHAGNMHPFVKTKATNQARRWDEAKLISFYEGLAKIDLASKTSGTPFNMKQSLEILACYYL